MMTDCPFPNLAMGAADSDSDSAWCGLLMESIGGLVILPVNGSKFFEIRVPVNSHNRRPGDCS